MKPCSFSGPPDALPAALAAGGVMDEEEGPGDGCGGCRCCRPRPAPPCGDCRPRPPRMPPSPRPFSLSPSSLLSPPVCFVCFYGVGGGGVGT